MIAFPGRFSGIAFPDSLVLGRVSGILYPERLPVTALPSP